MINKVSTFAFFYNQEKFVSERIESIFSQDTYLGEVFLIDDNSKDATYSQIISIVDKLPEQKKKKIQIIRFSESSGYAGGRWYLLKHATFPYIWIAEGDDSSIEGFLSEGIAQLDANLGCSFTWSQSKLVDEAGRSLGFDIDHHCAPHGTEFTSKEGRYGGRDFILKEVCHYNPFANVSACLFRRSEILNVLDKYGGQIMTARIASDWLLYLTLLQSSDVFVIAKPLNIFRRRIDSVSQSFAVLEHYWEYVGAQNFATNLYRISSEEHEVHKKQIKEKNNLSINLGIQRQIQNG